ncbi:MAG: biotin/lipoyl-containing protein [bacterium]
MNLSRVKRLVDLMEKTGLLELEVDEEEFRVKVKRSGTKPGPEAPSASAKETTPFQRSEEFFEILSPMVGTFRHSPNQDIPPYVKIGDQVRPGQPICIIEAMKVMNEVKAEGEGEIIDIMVEDGHPVEYGQPLFLIEKKSGRGEASQIYTTT